MTALDLGLLVLRVVVGLTIAAHGTQKAFGWWGGPGWQGWHGAVTNMGFRPPHLFTALSIGAELGGGLFLALGLLTPLAGALIVAQSVVIIVRSHAPNGFWNRQNGYEFPLMLAGGALALTLTGPGAVSVDALAGFELADEVRLGLVALALLGGGATVALPSLLARRDDEASAR
jgi:putative oxidoreductase